VKTILTVFLRKHRGENYIKVFTTKAVSEAIAHLEDIPSEASLGYAMEIPS
jgi:hypothetical protein